MPIDEKDVDYLIDRLKDTFVTKDNCQKHTDSIDGRFTNDLVRLTVIEQKLQIIMWLLSAVAGGVITVLIKLLFGV